MRQLKVVCSALFLTTGIYFVSSAFVNQPAVSQDFGFRGFGKALKRATRIPQFNAPSNRGSSGTSSRSRDGSQERNSGGENSDGGAYSSDSAAGPSREEQKANKAAEARLEAARAAKNLYRYRKEIQEQDKARVLERGRDVDQAIKDFISKLADLHLSLRKKKGADARIAQGTTVNEVTEGSVRNAIEAAYDKAGLNAFARMAGEMWTKDRLLVRIVDHSQSQLGGYFNGVGAQGPSMNDLKADVFPKSASNVYGTALELSELIGVSHSYDRFVRTVYENVDPGKSNPLTNGGDSRYERFVTAAINSVPLQKFVKKSGAVSADAAGLERNFQFRFRARRTLYDCLSANVPKLMRQLGGTTIDAAHQAPAGPKEKTRSAGVQANSESVTGPGMPTGTVAPAGTHNQFDAVWERTQQDLGSTCASRIAILAGEKVRPVPAHWSSDGDDEPASSGPALHDQIEPTDVENGGTAN
ncbi:MAG: hypothetical protein ABL894_10495 [Hyphomicrobium sp.]|mgnify:CR=1 FL=1